MRGTGWIGEESYGAIFKAMDTSTGEFYALKKVRLESEGEGISSAAISEITHLKEKTKHSQVSMPTLKQKWTVFKFVLSNFKYR